MDPALAVALRGGPRHAAVRGDRLLRPAVAVPADPGARLGGRAGAERREPARRLRQGAHGRAAHHGVGGERPQRRAAGRERERRHRRAGEPGDPDLVGERDDGAIRGGLDDIDPETLPRPFARGKLVDLVMLLIAALLLAASAGLTIATRVARGDVGGFVGLPGPVYEVGKVVVPIAVGTVLLVVLLRWAPSAGPPPRDSWPAALVGAVALWGLSVGFAAFIGSFGSYNVVYGSLAAVVVFLVFVYLAANLVLLTAAFAAEWRGGPRPPGPRARPRRGGRGPGLPPRPGRARSSSVATPGLTAAAPAARGPGVGGAAPWRSGRSVAARGRRSPPPPRRPPPAPGERAPATPGGSARPAGRSRRARSARRR